MNEQFLSNSEPNNESIFSRESLLTDTSYNEDFQILQDMGYKPIIIKKVYAFLRPNSLEEAITFMTEENGIYYHNFFKDYKHNKKTCYICNQPKEKHSDYFENDIDDDLENEDKGNYTQLIENLGKDFTCNICGENFKKNSNNIIKNNKCGDEYCNHCWTSYLKSKIEEGFVDKIKCMNFSCKEILSEQFIRSVIKDNKTLLTKYEKFLIKTEILNNKNKKFCPKKGCESYGEKKGKEKNIQCEKGHKFCFNCLKDWHGNEPCEKKEEEDFKIWKKDKIIKQCPNCKMWTEKNEGCNHMTCAECKYQWCWLCGGKYSSNHYYQGKCNGLQFYKPTSEEDIKRVLQNGNNNNNGRNLFNNYWREPQGLIPFRFYNYFNSIEPNNPLRSFKEINFFFKILYCIQYLLFGFNYISYRKFEVVLRDLDYIGDGCYYLFYFFFFLIMIFSFIIFWIPMCILMLIPMLFSFFYYPFLHKIWIYWWLNVIKNVGWYRRGY